MDDEVFDFAFNNLQNNIYGELALPIRKKLWIELGKTKKGDNGEICITEGLCRRVNLAKSCVEKVKLMWTEAFNSDKEIINLFNYIDKYLQGVISSKELLKVKNAYYNKFEEIAYDAQYNKIGLIGLAAVYVASIAVYDEPLLKSTDENDQDSELDSFTWDTSYLISLVYSDSKNKEECIARKREFWLWYLNQILVVSPKTII